MGKNKLTVIFGTAACRLAVDKGVEAAKAALDSGEMDSLQGSYHTYELDTEADLNVVKSVLEDFDGYNAYYWE